MSVVRLEESVPSALEAGVLVVDDNVANLISLEATLAPLGARVVRASSGEQALRLLLQEDFACVLLDVQMPGLDGLETAALIKQRKRSRHLPILFLTAIHKDPAYAFRGYASGAVDYLTKPFDPEILRTKVAVFVELFRRGERLRIQADELRHLERLRSEREGVLRQQHLTDSLPQSIWAADIVGRIYYANRAWSEYAGAQEAGPASLDDALSPADRERVRKAWVEASLTRRTFELEVTLRRFDGESRWHLLRVVPERDAKGEMTGWIAAATDIDDRIRMDEKTALLLEREQEARAQAEAANRAKDDFLAILSHELRTPLSSILGWAQMLGERTLDKTQTGRAVQTIDRNARALTRLIDELLDVSRIVAGKLRIETEPLDVALLLAAAVDAARPAAEAKQVELLPFAAGAPATVLGDAGRLAQIFANLLGNAVKFTPSGGKVETRLVRKGAAFLIEFEDSGVGISPEFLPFVFERFRQADSSTTRAANGLGLGLALVRHLAILHGGEVTARSAGVGKGATFTLSLPAQEAAPQPEPALVSAPGDAAPGARARALAGVEVLVVDDDLDVRDLLGEMLREQGATVRLVDSSEAALQAIQVRPPDVLLSDLGLPSEDGYALIRRVRALGPGKGGEVPAAAITAYAGTEARRRALDSGFQEHLGKPFEPAQLTRLVAGLLGR